MNTKTTFAVLMIAVLLGVYFLLFETDLIRQNSQPDSSGDTIVETAMGQPLFTEQLLPAQVKQLSITIGKHPPFVVEHKEDDWRQTQPFTYDMTGWKIDELVTNALKLHYTHRVKAEDLKAYGLNPPQAMLTLITEDGKSHTLKLGSTAPAGGAYLMLDDQPDVYIVNATLHGLLLGKTPAEFRNTSLPHVAFGQVQQVTLQRDGIHVAINRSAPAPAPGSSNWSFTDGAAGRASGESVESMVNTINFAAIDKFIADQPDDLARFGLDQPQIVFTVTQSAPATKDDKSKPAPVKHTLRVGSATDLDESGYYAMYDDVPVVFTLPKSNIDRLMTPIKQLRDARLTPVNRADVREVTVKPTGDDAQVVHLIKSEGRWSFGEPKPAYQLEPAAVDQLLDSIFKAKANDYVDMAKTADAKPLTHITLALAGAAADQHDQLTIFKHGDNALLIRHDDEPVGYIVHRSAMAAALKDKLFYRDRTVLDVAATDLASIHVERHGKFAATYDLKRNDSGGFANIELDGKTVSDFVKALTPLRAAAWQPNGDAFTDADETIALTTTDGKQHRIELDQAAMLGRTDAGVFSLNVPTIDALYGELRDQVVVSLDVNQIAKVEYAGTTITRDPNGQINAEGGKIDSQHAGQLLDKLAGLRAEHFLPDGAVKMDLQHPVHTLVITPRQGQPITLSIWPPEANDYNMVIGRINDGPLFTLAANPLQSAKIVQ